MRAVMQVSGFSDFRVYQPGDILEGDEAIRMCAAGLATPITDEKRQTATANTSKRETRVVNK